MTCYFNRFVLSNFVPMIRKYVGVFQFYLVLIIPSFGQLDAVRLFNRPQINSNQPVTAIAIHSIKNLGLTTYAIMDQDTITIPLDPDAPEFTYFHSFSKNYNNPKIFVLAEPEVTIYLINSGDTPNVQSSVRLAQNDCDFSFSYINQSDWRSGLSAPNYSRSFTTVQHVVIHHAAGSNTNTNYTQVVRDIYVYHTQVNGWSDIGYNYLIAQNGAIYAGRDPGAGQQDNVLGAHFCGSNSGTMGICLLGNYETAEPSIATFNSLKTLVSYKLDKENLDPQSNYPHSFGNLGSVIGHRDGCSTLCPGENVYNQLGIFRIEVANLIQSCEDRSLGLLANSRKIALYEDVTFYNTSEGYDSYSWTLPGAEPESANWVESGQAIYTQTGSFDVSLVGLIDGLAMDTLVLKNYMEVEKGSVIAPNPVAANARIIIQSEAILNQVKLYNLLGVEYIIESNGQVNSFEIPDLESGIYILKIPQGKKFREEKLIVF